MRPATKILAIGIAATALCAGCQQDDVKIADVPRKDIPKEAYNQPIPADAYKYMNRGSGPQAKAATTHLSGEK